MYLVTILTDGIETVINAVSTDINAPKVTGTVKQGINSIDSFSFTILPNNKGYNLIGPYKTLVKVYNTKTNKYEFTGRVLKPSGNMSSSGLVSKTFICESELGYLIDSTQLYGEYHNVTIEKYLGIMIDRHNLNRENYKKFKLGNITVKDNNDSLYKNMAYDTTWKNMNDDLLDTYGGELQIRYEGDEKYLDYLSEIGEVKETEIRLGKNIQDITEDKDPTSYVTRLYPLGCKLKTTDDEGNEKELEERLTIASINGGVEYIDDKDAVSEFGIIEGFVIWDDVTGASNLKRKGEEYLKSQRIIISNKVTALDLSIIGLDIDSFDVGNYHPLRHELLGINYTIRIIEKSISIENPQASSLTFGDRFYDIKKYQLDVKKQYSKVSKENNEIKKSVNQVRSFATNEIYRVDGNINNLIVDVSNEFNNVNDNLNNVGGNITTVDLRLNALEKTVETDINTIKNDIGTIKIDITSMDSKLDDILSKLQGGA